VNSITGEVFLSQNKRLCQANLFVAILLLVHSRAPEFHPKIGGHYCIDRQGRYFYTSSYKKQILVNPVQWPRLPERNAMEFSPEVKEMVCINQGPNNGPAPIPTEGRWVQAREVKDISGLTHGVGWCAPQQGACKLTLNVKEGIIKEALAETVGCTGMTHSAAMAAEILPEKTILEALNTDLVCDAINVAMRELFLQIVYGRTQTAFSEDGLPIGAGLEDLGKGLRSVTGTMYGTSAKGPRYLEMAEGYVTRLALDDNDEIIGYEFVKLGPMMELIGKGVEAGEALKKSIGTYGRFAEARRTINPRKE